MAWPRTGAHHVTVAEPSPAMACTSVGAPGVAARAAAGVGTGQAEVARAPAGASADTPAITASQLTTPDPSRGCVCLLPRSRLECGIALDLPRHPGPACRPEDA